VQQEQELAIALARQAGTEAAVEAAFGVLGPDLSLDLGPVDAERRVGDPVVKARIRAGMSVLRQAVAEADVRACCPLTSMSARQIA
jgi:hypothetical protein